MVRVMVRVMVRFMGPILLVVHVQFFLSNVFFFKIFIFMFCMFWGVERLSKHPNPEC